ncbi:MAG: hypothetical protein ACLTXM_11995 [Enterococcus sp.]
MEKVNELVQQLIKICDQNDVNLTIAMTEKNGKTQVDHSGTRRGIMTNIETAIDAATELFGKNECDCPICQSVKKAFAPNSKNAGSRHLHVAEIKTKEDLDAVLEKIFGGK